MPVCTVCKVARSTAPGRARAREDPSRLRPGLVALGADHDPRLGPGQMTWSGGSLLWLPALGPPSAAKRVNGPGGSPGPGRRPRQLRVGALRSVNVLGTVDHFKSETALARVQVGAVSNRSNKPPSRTRTVTVFWNLHCTGAPTRTLRDIHWLPSESCQRPPGPSLQPLQVRLLESESGPVSGYPGPCQLARARRVAAAAGGVGPVPLVLRRGGPGHWQSIWSSVTDSESQSETAN